MKLRKHAKVHIGAIFWGLLITGLILTSIPQTVLADDDDMVLDSETSLDFYLNGIYYYDPGGSAASALLVVRVVAKALVELKRSKKPSNNTANMPCNCKRNTVHPGR